MSTGILLNIRPARIESLDVCKGVAILAVIFGHAAQRYGISLAMQFVYAFHMPLFFCIAGYFISDKKPFVIFVREKAKRLFYPYGVSCAGFVILNTLKNPTI